MRQAGGNMPEDVRDVAQAVARLGEDQRGTLEGQLAVATQTVMAIHARLGDTVTKGQLLQLQ